MKTYASLDIETLGKRSSAVVTVIGVQLFDAQKIYPEAAFLRKLRWQPQFALERSVDESTLEFWFKQPKEAQLAMAIGDKVHHSIALLDLVKWSHYQTEAGRKIEGWFMKDPDFDGEILKSLAWDSAAHDDENDWLRFIPWAYRNTRSVRELDRYLLPEERPKFPGQSHTADADSLYQAELVQRVWDKIGEPA